MASIAPRSGRRGRRAMNDINMVPFIDVMLVLLIIFMVTAPLISPSVIDLPSVGKASVTPTQVLQIEISKDEKITIKSTGSVSKSLPSSLSNLVRDVRDMTANATDVPVVISADRSIKYESVVKAMDTLQRAGIARVGLSVQLTD
ncbi:MAG: ExbD/TolR family protein [Burkholderiales bacterium]|jgi:biopolymer transport protein TolR|nr:ExbD/TolR family protein [Burkholderiales bacterium]